MLSDQEIRIVVGQELPEWRKNRQRPPIQLNYPLTFIFRESDLKNLGEIEDLLSAIAEIPETDFPSLRKQAAIIEACTLGRHDNHRLGVGHYEREELFGELVPPASALNSPRLKARNRYFARQDFIGKSRDRYTVEDILNLHAAIHKGFGEIDAARHAEAIEKNSAKVEVNNHHTGMLRRDNLHPFTDDSGNITLLPPVYDLVETFLGDTLSWINDEETPKKNPIVENPIVKAIVGSYMFYAPQPLPSGNTAVKRILYEDILMNGGCDLRGIVSLAQPITYASMEEVYVYNGKDMVTGEVRLDEYIKIMGQHLAESLKLALRRSQQVQVPYLNEGGLTV